MRKTFLPTLLLAGLCIGLTGLSARAQSIEIGPRGVRVYPDDRWDGRRGHWDGRDHWDRRRGDWDRRRGISEWEARRIARRYGMADVWNAYRSDRVWVVAGADWRGRRMQVVIHRWTGDVVDIDRGRRG